MENASKALLLAAGVLIGIVILSLAAYLFGTFSSSTAEMKKEMENGVINNFNNQFFAYEGKKDLTIYDVYTVANLAEENNKKYNLQDEGIKSYNYYVAVFLTIDGTTKQIEKNKLDYKEFVDEYMYVSEIYNSKDVYELIKFTCTVEINDNTGRINKVMFSKTPTTT